MEIAIVNKEFFLKEIHRSGLISHIEIVDLDSHQNLITSTWATLLPSKNHRNPFVVLNNVVD